MVTTSSNKMHHLRSLFFLATFVFSSVARADPVQMPRVYPSSFLAISDVFTEEPIIKDGQRIVRRLFEQGSITIKDNNVGELCSEGCDIITNEGKDRESIAHTNYNIVRVTDKPIFYFDEKEKTFPIDYTFKIKNDNFYNIYTTQFFYANGGLNLKYVTEGLFFKGKIVFPKQ